MKKHDLIDITMRLLRDDPKEKAILVTDDDKTKVWLPRSQIEYELNDKEGFVDITLPEWLAAEKELI